MATLGLNVDHIATVRQARGGTEPDPVAAAAIGEQAGATCITIHLREDRRHIQDHDLLTLRRTVTTKLNLEMAATAEMIGIACSVHPDQVTLVPEKRQELTTEGGLDVAGLLPLITEAVQSLRRAGIIVSLFIDPNQPQIDAAVASGAQAIEIHTGRYADAENDTSRHEELQAILDAITYARSRGLIVHAGHGLNYTNIAPLANHPDIDEFNIGHSIVSRALFSGLERAVSDMVALLKP
jgi:pyridoxine 5-phosphate synthase